MIKLINKNKMIYINQIIKSYLLEKKNNLINSF